MKASDLAERIPLVTWDTDAVTAARVLAEYRAGSLVVADADGVPQAVISGTDLLRLVVPRYVLDDPRLAHVYDEAGAGEVVAKLRERRLSHLVDDGEVTPRELPSVLPEDTLIEIAALMCRRASPVVLIRDRKGGYHGVVTLSRLTAAVLEATGTGTEQSARRLQVDLVDGQDDAAPAGPGPDEGRG
jgi:CBS domain-containing protein